MLYARTGFMGGTVPHPTYEQVCAERTGHAETVAVTYDTRRLSHQRLLREFFLLHDFTLDRRAASDGQYRSAIFPDYEGKYGAAQASVAREMIARLADAGLAVSTEISSAALPFYPAADRHQQYCSVRGIAPKSRAAEKIGEILTF